MGKRTNEADIIGMALLYNYQCDGTKMISYEKVLEYDEIINQNLDNMNSSCLSVNMGESKLYFIAKDSNNNVYYVINPIADLKEARSIHIGCLPIDIVVASQMPNALEVLGLELDGGIFKRKSSKVKKRNDV